MGEYNLNQATGFPAAEPGKGKGERMNSVSNLKTHGPWIRRVGALTGIMLVMAGFMTPALAVDRYVSPFGTNNPPYASWADAARP